MSLAKPPAQWSHVTGKRHLSFKEMKRRASELMQTFDRLRPSCEITRHGCYRLQLISARLNVPTSVREGCAGAAYSLCSETAAPTEKASVATSWSVEAHRLVGVSFDLSSRLQQLLVRRS